MHMLLEKSRQGLAFSVGNKVKNPFNWPPEMQRFSGVRQMQTADWQVNEAKLCCEML